MYTDERVRFTRGRGARKVSQHHLHDTHGAGGSGQGHLHPATGAELGESGRRSTGSGVSALPIFVIRSPAAIDAFAAGPPGWTLVTSTPIAWPAKLSAVVPLIPSDARPDFVTLPLPMSWGAISLTCRVQLLQCWLDQL